MVSNDFETVALSILTGGFVLILVEIGNRKNRNFDIHYQIMQPFMKKLSSYFRFIKWMYTYLQYPNDEQTGYEKEFERLINVMQKYGDELITRGGDYPVDYFDKEKLDQIAKEITNIWYCYDRMNPQRISFVERVGFCDEFIDKELSAINPKYLGRKKDVSLIANVSGDFYTDVYQNIESELYRYSEKIKTLKKQTNYALGSVAVICVILIAIILIPIPAILLKLIVLVVVGMFLGAIYLLCGDGF